MSRRRSSKLAIELSNVSVHFRIPTERITTLKEQALRRVLGRRVEHRDFWALRDLDLQVSSGEALGIIGRNGAGKSTLLKVVSRILPPTQGNVRVEGSIAPLIELGAGFHSELTGRENIFMNGAMLGFSRAEMQRKFDRIVAFAELADFIDAPLRVYSSGMVMRLAFAIASDVDPDILIIDEILAVGDEAFQQKCLARMEQFRKKGTTILFVSHALDSVQNICDRAVWLDEGGIQSEGPVDEVIGAYTGQA